MCNRLGTYSHRAMIESVFSRRKQGGALGRISRASRAPILNVSASKTRQRDLADQESAPGDLFTPRNLLKAAGSCSYAASINDLYRRAAAFVNKILKGAKPADLPVEQPIKFEFIINLKAAKQIGLTIPPNVLVRADRVIR